MKMEKAEIEKRVNSLREDMKSNPNTNNLKNPNDKECPFSGKVCSSRCKLFRSNHPGYECPFNEIPSMSWNLKDLVRKLIG